MITARNLSYSINKNTLFTGLNFECKSCTVFQILGSNGSGKTTLLKILSGITQPTKGEVEIIGYPKKIFLGHKIPIKDYLTNLQNFSFLNPCASFKDYSSYCEAVNLGVSKSMYSSNLSFGQKKKLLLSKIFQQSFDILFLDEPFVGLDKKTINLVKDRIIQLKQNGALVFITSHQETIDGDVVIDLDTRLIDQ